MHVSCKGEVTEVTVKDHQEFVGTLEDGQKFQSVGVLSDLVLEELNKSEAKFQIEKDESNSFLFLLLNWLPMIFLFVLFFQRRIVSGLTSGAVKG